MLAGWRRPHGASANPKPIYDALVGRAPQFKGRQQHDSHELLRVLLDGLEVGAPFPCELTARCLHSAFCDATVANRTNRVALERWTNPKLSRRTCSPRYELQPWRRKPAGVAKRPRELISHTVTIRNF